MEGQITIGLLETLVFLGATVLSVGIAYGSLKKQVEELKESASKDIRPELKGFADRLPRLEERLGSVISQLTDIEQSFTSTRSRFGDLELGVGSVNASFVQLTNRVQHVDDLVQTVNMRSARLEEQAASLDKHVLRIEQGIAVIDGIRERIKGLESRFEVFWRDRYAVSNSPRQLNEYGEQVLAESGIKEYIEDYLDELSEAIEEAEPQNPYDAEQLIVDAVRDLPKQHPEIVNDLKQGAFKTGADLDGVLYVGALYLRNQLFPELGFDLADLDDTSSVLPMHPPERGLMS